MTKTTVLLAEDHPAVMLAIRATLDPFCHILGAMSDGLQAIKAVASLDPDVLFLDVSLPLLDGFQAARQLRKDDCRTKIIFLTNLEDKELASAALCLGARGYVMKNRLLIDLVPALEAVVRGEIFVSPFKEDHPRHIASSGNCAARQRQL